MQDATIWKLKPQVPLQYIPRPLREHRAHRASALYRRRLSGPVWVLCFPVPWSGPGRDTHHCSVAVKWNSACWSSLATGWLRHRQYFVWTDTSMTWTPCPPRGTGVRGWHCGEESYKPFLIAASGHSGAVLETLSANLTCNTVLFSVFRWLMLLIQVLCDQEGCTEWHRQEEGIKFWGFKLTINNFHLSMGRFPGEEQIPILW